MTNEDTSLLKCLPDKQEKLRQLIDVGKPYVWELRLSLEEFYEPHFLSGVMAQNTPAARTTEQVWIKNGKYAK